MWYILMILLAVQAVASWKVTVFKRKETPYLIRYTLLNLYFFTIKIHKVLISDKAVLHDHPWNYMSIILKGGYFEERLIEVDTIYDLDTDIATRQYRKFIKWHGPGSILFRNGKIPHRLLLREDFDHPDKEIPSISLIITTLKYRDWGFMFKTWTSHKEVDPKNIY